MFLAISPIFAHRELGEGFQNLYYVFKTECFGSIWLCSVQCEKKLLLEKKKKSIAPIQR